jgi:hypothetical protein
MKFYLFFQSEKVPKSRLNQEYQALMGEANLAYVHGDIPKAIRICQEVITNGKILLFFF